MKLLSRDLVNITKLQNYSFKYNPRYGVPSQTLINSMIRTLKEYPTAFHLLAGDIITVGSDIVVNGGTRLNAFSKIVNMSKKDKELAQALKVAKVYVQNIQATKKDIITLSKISNTTTKVDKFDIANLSGKFTKLKDSLRQTKHSQYVQFKTGCYSVGDIPMTSSSKRQNLLPVKYLLQVFASIYGKINAKPSAIRGPGVALTNYLNGSYDCLITHSSTIIDAMELLKPWIKEFQSSVPLANGCEKLMTITLMTIFRKVDLSNVNIPKVYSAILPQILEELKADYVETFKFSMTFPAYLQQTNRAVEIINAVLERN